MIRAGFLDPESRSDLIDLARDGSVAHRLARRAWYRLYKDEGIEGLASFGYDGSTCRLSDAQQDKLRTWIAETLPRTTREVGVWMKINGESIYGTTASPFGTQLSFGRATSKPGRVYLHVFDWPANGVLRLPSWGANVEKAYLLSNRQTPLRFEQNHNEVTIKVPATAPNPIASVIVIEAVP
jgi:hypothetical protein